MIRYKFKGETQGGPLSNHKTSTKSTVKPRLSPVVIRHGIKGETKDVPP